MSYAQAAELFHTADGTGFADLDVNGHRQTLAIRGKGFRRWLARRFFQETGGAPGPAALQSALNVIDPKAHFDGPERVVHIRVGGLDGRLYLDLGDKKWRAVEIDATGWRVINNPPVTAKRAVVHIDAADGSEDVAEAIRATAADTEDAVRDMEEDEAMTPKLPTCSTRAATILRGRGSGAARGHATMVGRHAGPRPRGARRGRGTVHRRRGGTASLSGGRGAPVVRGPQEGTGQPSADPREAFGKSLDPTNSSGSAATKSTSIASSNGRCRCCCA